MQLISLSGTEPQTLVLPADGLVTSPTELSRLLEVAVHHCAVIVTQCILTYYVFPNSTSARTFGRPQDEKYGRH